MSCACSSTLHGTIRRDYSYAYETRHSTYFIFNGGWRAAMIVFGVLLVLLCGLLTGLTLAVCGLDKNYLHLKSVTGSAIEKRQAKEVLKMKQRQTWMLCSLILCTVACSQMFPFVVQSVYHGNQFWVPILISTLVMTTFAEIIPQYMIPQQAIAWGYYCWPVIWGCMWATCLITVPLAWLLDRIRVQEEGVGIFKNDELQAVIQYHEQSEKRGGKLGQDATRIMVGALKLDSKRLSSTKKVASEDIEKGDPAVAQDGVIVKWDAVKTVDINDTVDEAFINKVLGWSYSRIPVIGKVPRASENTENHETEGWEGNKIFGFIHVKNLIGIDFKTPAKAENKFKVKDLSLYPLPIVKADMSVYELLNLLQMGMSRMAIIVPSSSVAGKTGSPLWTATERTNTHLMSNLKTSKPKSHWTMDYLKFAQASALDPDHVPQNVQGVDCPKPLGIVTFEDIIDAILQKTSRDERDFFDRDCTLPPTKAKKSGDFIPLSGALKEEQSLPRSPKKAHVTFEKSANPGTLRKRNVSNRVSEPCCGLDGANDRSYEGNYASSIRLPKKRRKSTGSSYTDNSEGGFHGADDSAHAVSHPVLMTAEEIIELANTSSSDCPGNPYSHVKTASLPTRRSEGAVSEESKRSRTVSASPRLPQLRRVAPFSRASSPTIEKYEEGQEMTEFPTPVPFRAPGPFPAVALQLRYNPNVSGIDIEEMEEPTELASRIRATSGETVSLMSWSSDDDAQQVTCVYDALPVPVGENQEISFVQRNLDAAVKQKEQTKPYDGFPPELLDNTNKENRVPDFASKTLPRTIGNEFNLEELAENANATTPPLREGSFHDDRALLPSQRRQHENGSVSGNRSSSLWF